MLCSVASTCSVSVRTATDVAARAGDALVGLQVTCQIRARTVTAVVSGSTLSLVPGWEAVTSQSATGIESGTHPDVEVSANYEPVFLSAIGIGTQQVIATARVPSPRLPSRRSGTSGEEDRRIEHRAPPVGRPSLSSSLICPRPRRFTLVRQSGEAPSHGDVRTAQNAGAPLPLSGLSANPRQRQCRQSSIGRLRVSRSETLWA